MKGRGDIRHRTMIYGMLLLLAGCETLPPAERYDAPVRPELREATIVIYGDSRPSIWPVFRDHEDADVRVEVVRRIAQEAPDLVLHSGDLVFNGAHAESWGLFDVEHQPLRDRRIPFYPVLGNHEYFLDSKGLEKFFFPRFPMLGGRMWYDVRQGPVLFLMLNSNFSRLADEEIEAQDRWLEDQLAKAKEDAGIRAVIAVCHHPPYTNAVFSSINREVEGHFVARMHGHPKVKAMFFGHVHSYERFLIDGTHYVVSGGGGAPLVPIQQDPAKTTFRDLCPTQDRRYNFCLGHLTSERLTFEVYNLNRDMTWSVMDAFEIDMK